MPDPATVTIPDGPWPYGIDSVTDPMYVASGAVAWSVNTLNKGGIYQTRPGFSIIYDRNNTGEPRGLTFFSPKNLGLSMVKAAGTQVRVLHSPFSTSGDQTFNDGSCVASPTFLSGTANFTTDDIGLPISGFHIQANTTILSIDSSISVQLSLTTTGDGTGISFTISNRNNWKPLSVTLADADSPAYLTNCIKGAITESDGTLTLINAYPMMIIQDALSKAWSWDGTTAIQLDPDPNGLAQSIIGSYGTWAGNRYWVAQGPNLYASNLLEPDKFTETQQLAGGGYFVLPDNITGIGVTSDQQSLLVFTASTTTSFSITIPREQWTATPGFQTVILPTVGCVAHRTIINQYGMMWWMSQGGLINLDEALSAYRTKRIRHKDKNLNRSKANISNDRSRACSGSYENFMQVSVPSGDSDNAHTWILDELPTERDETSFISIIPTWASIWTGIKPVQWATITMGGHTRCFVLSRDATSGTGFSGNVWEVFIGTRQDIGATSLGVPTLINIPCSLETRYLSNDTQFKTFSYASSLVSELGDTSTHQWYYASRHSGFKQVLSKTVQSTTASLDHRSTNIGPNSIANIRQSRELRSDADVVQKTDTGLVESNYTREKDRGFYLLVKWQGPAAYDFLALYCQPRGDLPTGRVEKNETTNRTVNASGAASIGTTSPIPTTILGDKKKTVPVMSVASRVTEDLYSVLTATSLI